MSTLVHFFRSSVDLLVARMANPSGLQPSHRQRVVRMHEALLESLSALAAKLEASDDDAVLAIDVLYVALLATVARAQEEMEFDIESDTAESFAVRHQALAMQLGDLIGDRALAWQLMNSTPTQCDHASVLP